MVRTWCEFVLVYVALPLLAWAARAVFDAGVPLLAVLWTVAVPAALVLRVRYGWGREAFLGLGSVGWGALGLRVAVAAVGLAVLLLAVAPDCLFDLPRRDPRLWALVMVAYPVLSVYPQGVVYRGLFYARYAGLFGSERRACWAGAAAFAWGHVAFGNVWAVALTFVGGLLVNRAYRRSGSLLASDVEHALYGQLVFTLGWGRFLHLGTVRLLETLSR